MTPCPGKAACIRNKCKDCIFIGLKCNVIFTNSIGECRVEIIDQVSDLRKLLIEEYEKLCRGNRKFKIHNIHNYNLRPRHYPYFKLNTPDELANAVITLIEMGYNLPTDYNGMIVKEIIAYNCICN